ncbi:MAG: hypothetical protein LIO77_09960, partial [Rikenellaceae bacterium]|nr:hypothetical protein [Rikenellaceae bacterium]
DTGSELRPAGNYIPGEWVNIAVGYDCAGLGEFSVCLDGEPAARPVRFAHAVKSLERLVVRTGEYRDKPDRTTPNQEPGDPLPGADVKVPVCAWNVDNVNIYGS